MTNDPVNETIFLEVKGPVEQVVKIDPKTVVFKGPVSNEFEQVVYITPSEKYRFSITDLVLKNGLNITADLLPPGEEGDSTWQLVVKNIRKEPGRYFDTIVLATDSQTMPELKIRVFGMFTEPGSDHLYQ